MLHRLAFACALLALAAGLAAAAAEAPARPDLAGKWLLDAKRSDAPRGRFRGDGPPGGRAGGGAGRPPGGGELDEMRSRGEAMRAADAELELRREEAGGYLLIDGAGRAWRLPGDGREREAADAAGRRLWLRSEWDLEGRLVVRRVQDGRPARVDTYALDPADGSLVVTRRLSGERAGTGERRLVYRRAAPAAPAHAPATQPPPR